MEFFKKLKQILFEPPPSRQDKELAERMAYSAKKREERIALLPSLEEYESRRPEIAESTDAIDGVFYLYDGKIIPDHYSECLNADRDNRRRAKLFHARFYSDYMERKFNILNQDHRSIPRGRVCSPFINLDKCYEHSEDTIAQIRGLYRLSEDARLIINKEYSCPKCKNQFSDKV